MGSLAETETHLILATRLKYITRTEAAPIWKLAQEIGKMLHRFTAVLDPKPNKR